MWGAILIAAGGCYALKLAGLSVPQRVLDAPRVQRVALLLPVALLAALISMQTFGEGSTRAPPASARPSSRCSLRAPFLVVVRPPRPRPRCSRLAL